jgi:3-phenylpropionate/trans-cinnamate dioxygenase ferredoxin reductase subunit
VGRGEGGDLEVLGEPVGADCLLTGVGVMPETSLARTAELEVEDGVIVDEHLRACDESIWAIGDCANFPCATSGRRLRLESVQNATDQARTVVAQITGGGQRHLAVPWFWTEQHGHRVQIAGVATPDDVAVLRGDPADDAGFSVFRYSGDRLVAVESVDRAADHLAARRLLSGERPPPTPEEAADLQFPFPAVVAA